MTVPIPDWMRVEDSSWGDEEETDVTSYSFYKDSPEGEVILHYDDHAHAYYRFSEDGQRIDIPGVTTVLQIVDKSKPLMFWAVKLAINTIRDGWFNTDGSMNQFSTEEANMLLEDAKSKHTQHLEEAGDVGHIVHDILERAIKKAAAETNGVITDIDTSAYTDDRVVNRVRAALEWMTTHKVKFILTERKIYSRHFEVAGTGDGLAYVSSCDDPLCCKEFFQDRKDWLDWKTSNKMNSTYPAQTAIYMFSYIEETGERVVGRWVIKLNKETGKLEVLYRSPETFELDLEAFVKALELSNVWHALEDSIKEQKAEKRAALKAIRDEAKAIEEARERAERAVAKAERMAATKERNEAKDALYKSLRASGMNPTDAKAEVAIKFPPKPKADKDSDDEPEAQIESKLITVEEKPFEIEWILHL